MGIYVNKELREFFKKNDKLALAFSGGVDSTYLLYAALACGADVQAYFVRSEFQPKFEIEDVERIKNELSAKLKVLELSILENETVAANPEKRCYYCKREIMGAITAEAKADGFQLLMDGTNASDDQEDRPGMQALSELNIVSPLRLCGINKEQIRDYSRKAGLSTWDKPAYACLATRIPTGTRITDETLDRVQRCESAMYELGFRDFRVRAIGNIGKLQLRAEQLQLFVEKRTEILEALGSDFQELVLDLKTR